MTDSSKENSQSSKPSKEDNKSSTQKKENDNPSLDELFNKGKKKPTFEEKLFRNLLFADDGFAVSVLGQNMPAATCDEDAIIIRPADNPLNSDLPTQNISTKVDERGVLLDDNGNPKKVSGARYQGNAIFHLAELKSGTLKNYVVWFDLGGNARRLYYQGQMLTSDIIYKLRNRTHDGEISIFPELKSD